MIKCKADVQVCANIRSTLVQKHVSPYSGYKIHYMSTKNASSGRAPEATTKTGTSLGSKIEMRCSIGLVIVPS